MTKSTQIWHPEFCLINQTTGAALDSMSQDEGFKKVNACLERGGLVAIPTETVYGLAADATNPEAVAGIFAAKDRPSFNPLISHLPNLDAAQGHGLFNQDALTLAEAFWPGPLTLVIPKHPDSDIADLTSSGLETVALRVPDAPLMRALSHAIGKPLAAPSANRSGRVSPTSAAHVIEELSDRIDYVADLGPCRVGVESTVILCTDEAPVTLLRPGGIATEDIEQLLHRPFARAGSDDKTPSSPGMLTSHYAPSVPVRLDVETVEDGEALLAFGPEFPKQADNAVAYINLSPSGDSVEAAQQLFAALRSLDREDVKGIAVAPISNAGLGEAINDRLKRAARGR